MRKTREPVFDREAGCKRCWLLVEVDEQGYCTHCVPVMALVSTPAKQAALDRVLFGEAGL